MMPYKTCTYGSITVMYRPELDGGGRTFGQDYISYVREHIGKVDRVFEWCSGPGFIGFSLLAHDLCNTLCLADINPSAVEACKATVQANGLEDRLSVHLSNNLHDMPATEAWDLVVGNPPHSGTDQLLPWGDRLIYMDDGWRIHHDFYLNIARFLKPEGQIVIQENVTVSTADTFRTMIAEGGLKLIGAEICASDPGYYYIRSVKRHSQLAGPSGEKNRAEFEMV
jgi:methylase of polypeptide subunit release factors